MGKRMLIAVALAIPLAACSVLEGTAADDTATTPPPAVQTPAPEETLSRAQIEELVVDTVAEEVGVPRFLVTRYIENNGGFDALARRYGITDEQLARLDQGVTRAEVDTVLVPLVEELRARLGT